MTRAEGEGQRARRGKGTKGKGAPAGPLPFVRPPPLRDRRGRASPLRWSSPPSAGGGRASGPTIAATADRNVLLVTIDTLRADALGTYGGRAVTPNLDRLAARGARFTFAHAHAVVTLASHATILTRPLSVRARRPRQHRLSRRPTPSTAATRLKRRASPPARSSAASRSITDSDSTPDSTSTTTARRAAVDRTGERERRADAVVARRSTGSARSPASGSRGSTSTIRTRLRSRRGMGVALPRRSVLRRGGVDRRARPAVRSARRAVAPHARRRHRRSRREPRRARRGDAQRLRVRIDAARAADRRTSSTAAAARPRRAAWRSTHRCGTSICCRRFSRPCGAAAGAAGRVARPLIAAGGGADRPSYFEAMQPRSRAAGRRCAACSSAAKSSSTCRLPSCTTCATDPREARNLSRHNPDRAQVLLNTLKSFNVAPPGRPQAEIVGDARAPAIARLHRRRMPARCARSTRKTTIRSG